MALATFPATGSADGPNAVALVPADDWAAGIAASSLVGDPINSPILMSDGDELPELTEATLVALAPQGSAETQNRQVFAVGDAPSPMASGLSGSRATTRRTSAPRSHCCASVSPSNGPSTW